jgi:hypothetical protein
LVVIGHSRAYGKEKGRIGGSGLAKNGQKAAVIAGAGIAGGVEQRALQA